MLVTVTVTGVRFAWILATARLPGRLRPMGAQSWGALTVLAWAGMRGAVSLAAALALPLTTDAGTPFPNRDLIIFLTFGVILGTLVCQGLTLPVLIKLFHLEDDGLAEKEEAKARIKAAEAALARLDELESEGWAYPDTIERARGCTGSASTGSRPGSTRIPTGRPRSSHSSTSGSGASCSTPSGRRSSTCGAAS